MRDLSRDSVHLFVKDDVQLFIDNTLLEMSQDVTRRYYHPEPKVPDPVLKRDRPWEHLLYFTYSNHQVLRDPSDGLFKCWYEDLEGPDPSRSSHHFNMFSRQLYAQSENGVDWVKPELDVHPFEGAKTNIVMGDDEYGQVHSAAYVIDPDPDEPDERFRAIYAHYWDGQGGSGDQVECAHSPDGIRWSVYGQLPKIGRCGARLSDVSTLAYDQDAREFVQITRHFLQSSAPMNPSSPRARFNGSSFNRPHEPYNFASYSQRRLWLTTSADFIHWRDPIVVAATDDDDDNLDESYYGMPIYRRGTVYLGTAGVLHQVDNRMDVRLLMSRDLIRWRPVPSSSPFFAPGPEGTWYSGMVSMVSPPIEVGEELWFFHGGTRYHHDWFLRGPVEELDHPEARDPQGSDFGMGLATLRIDGFASLSANALREGTIATRALSGAGSNLRINGRCRPGGSITVELVDSHENIIPGCSKGDCDPLTGDSTSHLVTWKGRDTISHQTFLGDLSVCKVRFFLRDADLFAFQFTSSE